MYQVFNMGLGMIAAVPTDAVPPVRSAATDVGVDTWVVGEVVAGEGVRLR